MSTRRRFLWLAMAMIAGVAGILLVNRQKITDTSDVRSGTAIGEAISDIHLATFDGRELMTSDLHGKVVLINAFAS